MANNTTTDEPETTFKFTKDARVVLRADRADVYIAAFAGSEGWVRGRKIDDDGFKLIFIEWDKEHWTYNGQQDMWSFEDHFDEVEEEQVAETPDKEQIALALGVLAKALGAEPTSKDSDEEDTVGDDRAEEVTPEEFRQYEHILARAMEVVQDSDAFLIACVHKEDPPEGSDAKVMMVPHIFSYSLSPESGILLDAQLSEVIAASHQQLAVNEIHRHLSDDE